MGGVLISFSAFSTPPPARGAFPGVLHLVDTGFRLQRSVDRTTSSSHLPKRSCIALLKAALNTTRWRRQPSPHGYAYLTKVFGELLLAAGLRNSCMCHKDATVASKSRSLVSRLRQ